MIKNTTITTSGRMMNLETGSDISAVDFVSLFTQRRFNTVSMPGAIDISTHLIICGMVGAKYYRWFKDRVDPCPKHDFVLACYQHDLPEAFLSDIVVPVKNVVGREVINKIEDTTYAGIMNWAYGDETPINPPHEALKDADILAMIAELSWYLECWPNHKGLRTVLAQAYDYLSKRGLITFVLSKEGMFIRNPVIMHYFYGRDACCLKGLGISLDDIPNETCFDECAFDSKGR